MPMVPDNTSEGSISHMTSGIGLKM